MLQKIFKLAAEFASSSNYRSDLDGLRAFAVLSVILFHLQLPWLSGGYVGVDIFFVLSGYLMTSIVYRQSQTGNFSLTHFYERRVRRIVPSLLVVLFCSTLMAGLLFSTADLVKYADSMAAAVAMADNIFFYFHSGYFENDGDARPLLHLWSLGIEAQFYLIWPPVLVLMLRRLSAKHVRIAAAAVAVASLLGAVVMTGMNHNAAFYLIPFRLFEFLVGGAVVWSPVFFPAPLKKPWLDACTAGGLIILLLCVLLFTKETPFPSYYALLPCIGAALIIFGSKDSSLRVVLGNPLMAYLGRVSYELYLFHWAAITFYQYILFRPLQVTDIFVLIAVTFALSTFTYHFISYPLRYGYTRTLGQRQNFLIGCLAIGVAFLLCVASIKHSNGWPWRLSSEARLLTHDAGAFHANEYGGAGYKDRELVTLGDASTPPQFLLFGDSFAGQYAAALSEFLTAHHESAYLYHINGCLIMPHVAVQVPGQNKPECATAFARVQQVLQNNKLPVVMAQSWSSYKQPMTLNDGRTITFAADNNNDYYAFIIDGIERTRLAFGDHPFVFIGISPGIADQKGISRCFSVPTIIPNQCAANSAMREETRLNGQEFNLAATAYVAAHPEAHFINPRTALCHDGFCYAISSNKIFYSDLAHFTKDGATQVIDHYQALLLSLHP